MRPTIECQKYVATALNQLVRVEMHESCMEFLRDPPGRSPQPIFVEIQKMIIDGREQDVRFLIEWMSGLLVNMFSKVFDEPGTYNSFDSKELASCLVDILERNPEHDVSSIMEEYYKIG